MATKGERQALLFLAAVALLGAATRAYRARHVSVDSSDLDRQIDAVASSREGGARQTPAARKSRRSRPIVDSNDTTIVAQAPVAQRPAGPVDIDMAAAADIERLPGIGPAIASRIIADRTANGAFGCLEALDSVKGIGPAMLARIRPLVVFSGAPRAPCVTGGRLSVPRSDQKR